VSLLVGGVLESKTGSCTFESLQLHLVSARALDSLPQSSPENFNRSE
jgi:hypothetical protein